MDVDRYYIPNKLSGHTILIRLPASEKNMADFLWKEFLQRQSREVIAYPDLRKFLSQEMIDSEWLGYPPATEQEILEVEQRLGKKLPPSYREFLLLSNGWNYPSNFIYDLLPVAKVGWFRDLHKEDWLDPWFEAAAEYGGPTLTPDEEYFVYGPEQHPEDFRYEYWPDTLTISEDGDSAFLLLNPHVVDENGEWEAWFFAGWNCGATRYRNFPEMMQKLLERLIRLRDDSDK